ncbi:MAG: pitrilysin family protein [Bacillota bacterium]|nr:pitrilysin family protein [Bacillota bacterium]
MIKTRTLSNGVRCICENLPYLRSVSAGVWVNTGSRHETPEFWGISHFIEHMLFKGTQSRSARDIAEFADRMGGQINAFTARDTTCYYVKAIDKHMEECLEILSDMLLHSKFEKKDIELERGVIMEEISMYQDTPEELVHDILEEVCFQDQAIGRNILGSNESIETFDEKLIRKYMAFRYTPDNIVVSAAGNIDSEKFFSLVEKYFGMMGKVMSTVLTGDPPRYTVGNITVKKDIEQTHIALALEGVSRISEDIYAMSIVNNVLGGGVSSRLFQKIREDMGLAYTIYSCLTPYSDCGCTTIYAAVNPENADKVQRLIVNEIENIHNGISNEELQRAKEQVKAEYILASENTENRMSSMGKQWLLGEEIFTESEFIERVDRVTPEEAKKVIDKNFDLNKMSQALVTPNC